MTDLEKLAEGIAAECLKELPNFQRHQQLILSALNLVVAGAYKAIASKCDAEGYIHRSEVLALTAADAAQALAEHDEQMKAQARLEELVPAAESIEEMAVLLAEVHIRFGHKVLDAASEKETDKTFGDFARLYENQAKQMRLRIAALQREAEGKGK